MSIDDEIKAMTFAQVALMVVGAAAFGILWALATSTAPANCTKYTGPVAGYDYNGSRGDFFVVRATCQGRIVS